jgi:hypothetical protein
VGIQKGLANKHLQEGRLVLYDITSSYFEGQYENTAIQTVGEEAGAGGGPPRASLLGEGGCQP